MRWSAQLSEDATVDEIAERFREYTQEQLEGAINTIKGKMFEIMVTNAENSDNDAWQAQMHEDESYPGSESSLQILKRVNSSKSPSKRQARRIRASSSTRLINIQTSPS